MLWPVFNFAFDGVVAQWNTRSVSRLSRVGKLCSPSPRARALQALHRWSEPFFLFAIRNTTFSTIGFC